jgi:hypothetical protein
MSITPTKVKTKITEARKNLLQDSGSELDTVRRSPKLKTTASAISDTIREERNFGAFPIADQTDAFDANLSRIVQIVKGVFTGNLISVRGLQAGIAEVARSRTLTR